MIIKRLNAVFHKHSKVLFGAFTLIIIVSFMGFLTPGQFGCSGYGGGNQAVGEVYGKKVSMEDLQDFYRKYIVFPHPYELDENALFELYCLNARAEQLGVQVTDADVAKFLRLRFGKKFAAIYKANPGMAYMLLMQMDDAPALADEYDPAAYRAFVDELKKRGFGEDDLAESIRLQLKQKKLREYLLSQIVITPSEVEAIYREYNTKMHFKVASFAPEKVRKPTDAELKKFYADNREWYRCAKVAVFPIAGKDVEAARKRAADFCREVKKAETGKRAAAFDAAAKQRGVKVLPPAWIAADGETAGGVKAVVKEVFDATARNPLSKPVVGDKAVYVACLLEVSGRDPVAGMKSVLEKHWRIAEAQKQAAEKAKQLNAIADRALREKEFLALKNVTFADETRTGFVPGIRVGDAMPANDRIYMLKSIEVPKGAMPAKDEPLYRDRCRAAKLEAELQSFHAELRRNCKSFMNREGRR